MSEFAVKENFSFIFLLPMKLLYVIFLLSLVLSISIDLDSLSSLLDEEYDEEDDMSRSDFEVFLEKYGDDYGYNNTINTLRSEETRRFKGATYLDYTGAGVYRESQIRKCADLLTTNLYGNAHSVNPSSKRTENLVYYNIFNNSIDETNAKSYSEVFQYFF